jgi:simple sugar transport system permease protein
MDQLFTSILAWINYAFVFGSVLMFGALGETVTEKSGNMNLGIPGIMCIGGVSGFSAAYLYELSCANAGNEPSAFLLVFLSLLCAFLGAALAGLLFSFLTTTLRVNQNVTGLTLTIFGVGLAKFMVTIIKPKELTTIRARAAAKLFSAAPADTLKDGFWATPFGEVVKTVFFDYGFMFYLSIVLVILAYLFFRYTKVGLSLRAVGENPATADAAGINVVRYRYLATVIGSGIAGLGAVYYFLDYNNGLMSTVDISTVETLGWLALALVIFALWRPLNLLWGAAIFGVCYWLYNYIGAFGLKLTTWQNSLLESIPYLVTIVVLVITSLKKKKENQAPQGLGLSYFREDR